MKYKCFVSSEVFPHVGLANMAEKDLSGCQNSNNKFCAHCQRKKPNEQLCSYPVPVKYQSTDGSGDETYKEYNYGGRAPAICSPCDSAVNPKSLLVHNFAIFKFCLNYYAFIFNILYYYFSCTIFPCRPGALSQGTGK